MLNEESLILLGVLAAAACLVLGVLELLWPTRPRHARRGPAPRAYMAIADDARPVEVERVGGDAPALVPAAPAVVLDQARDAVVTEGGLVARPASPVVPAPEAPADDDVVVPRFVEPVEPPAVAPVPVAEPDLAPGDPAWVLDQCRALAAQDRFTEVVTSAMAVLEQPEAAGPDVTAALWREVAIARGRLDDRDGALAAFRKAIFAAPEAGRARVRAELGAWAATAAGEMTSAAAGDERFAAIRAARALVDAAADITGDDLSIDEARADLATRYWPACEAEVRARIAAEDVNEAYRLATEALSDTTLPAERRPAFEELRAATTAARLVSLADRATVALDEGRDWDAVGALERAETLLKSSASGLSAERREEITRRLGEQYTRLGRRRVDGGEFEDAVDPLFRALRLGTGTDESRWAMVQALQGVVEARVAMIREVAATGSRDSAVVQADKLWALLRSGMAAGVPQESLTAALATTRTLLEEFGTH